LRQLTQGGCCTQPFWAPDSQRLLFIDTPGPELPVGIWGVDVTQVDPTPVLLTERIAYYSADMAFVINLGEDTTTIERLTEPLTGTVAEQWTVPADGRRISISPDQKRIAWQVSDDDLPSEERITQVWVANFDGSEARSVATLPRGGFSGWISDDLLLLSSSESLETPERILYTLSLSSGATTELVRGERIRDGAVSPDGTWLSYMVTLSTDLAQDGLWLVRTDGTERRKLDADLFGAYQWRDANHLVIVPFRPDAVNHQLLEFDVNTGETRVLTEPSITPFKIANGDWSVSPDGRYVAFVKSQDRNIWLLTLAD